MTRREKTVEKYLKQRVELLGGACEKFRSMERGHPDRLCSFRNGYHCLVETKWAEDAEPEDHQIRKHLWWRARGMDVYVLRSRAEVDDWLRAYG
jgi:hypothetical protein